MRMKLSMKVEKIRRTQGEEWRNKRNLILTHVSHVRKFSPSLSLSLLVFSGFDFEPCRYRQFR